MPRNTIRLDDPLETLSILTDEVLMVFFGDSATSEGDFHEAMNFAAVFQTPLADVTGDRKRSPRRRSCFQAARRTSCPGGSQRNQCPLIEEETSPPGVKPGYTFNQLN